ncbi:MAG: hypothetical protein L3J35_00005 [Bacteroidales bacterium]|nr:hypothetical protein [Bacteroidales bacterium]
MDYKVLISYDLDCKDNNHNNWEEFKRFMIEQILWDGLGGVDSTFKNNLKKVFPLKTEERIKELIEIDLKEAIFQLDFLNSISYTFQYNDEFESESFTLNNIVVR